MQKGALNPFSDLVVVVAFMESSSESENSDIKEEECAPALPRAAHSDGF